MNMKVTAGQVFAYMTSVGGSAAYIAWGGIIFTHLRVRSGLEKQGIHPSTYPFKSFGSIWIYRFNLFLNIFILFIQGFTAFERPFNWRNFIASYITLPTTIVLFIGYKLYHKTRWYVPPPLRQGHAADGRRVRLSEMDFSGRLVKIDEEEGEKKASLLTWSMRKFRS